MNKYGEDGWDEFQLVEKKITILWSREAAIITFSRVKVKFIFEMKKIIINSYSNCFKIYLLSKYRKTKCSLF